MAEDVQQPPANPEKRGANRKKVYNMPDRRAMMYNMNERHQIDVAKARAGFKELVDQAKAGQTFELTRYGKVVALLTPPYDAERQAEADRKVSAAFDEIRRGTTTTERVFGAEAALGSAPPGGWPAPIPPLDAVADPVNATWTSELDPTQPQTFVPHPRPRRKTEKPDPLDGTVVRRPGEYSAAELDDINRERLARTGKKK